MTPPSILVRRELITSGRPLPMQSISASASREINIRPKPRLDYLDSIRALAALGVAYLHSSLTLAALAHGPEARAVQLLTHFVDTGKIGVIAFFLVSGFVIPMSLKSGPTSKAHSVRDFVIGRFFRLYPAYWLSMALAFILLFHWSLAECSLKRLLLNVTMFQGFFGGVSINMIGLYWTLQIEWMFYILCILLFLTGWISKPKNILIAYSVFLFSACALAGLRYATHRAYPVAAPLGLSVMLLGTLWRMERIDGLMEARRHVRIALSAFILVIPFISLLAYNFNEGFDETWYRYTLCYWIAIGSFFLLTTRLRITWKPLVLVGRASFSLYLFSDFVRLGMERLIPYQRIANISLHLWLSIEMIVSCAVSFLIYTYLESPCLSLGKQLIRWLRRPIPAAPKSSVEFAFEPVND